MSDTLTYTKRRLGQVMQVTSEAIEDKSELIQIVKGLLDQKLRALANAKGYKADGECTFSVGSSSIDPFASNRRAVLGELAVLLTKRQDIEWQIESMESGLKHAEDEDRQWYLDELIGLHQELAELEGPES